VAETILLVRASEKIESRIASKCHISFLTSDL
jgi:hypothetical protein